MKSKRRTHTAVVGVPGIVVMRFCCWRYTPAQSVLVDLFKGYFTRLRGLKRMTGGVAVVLVVVVFAGELFI